ncbi:MAG TPA: penicillin acylase family protein [Polyangiales bacterium]|nr:penicillin acylase family protein [Polyangiales bacterium]
MTSLSRQLAHLPGRFARRSLLMLALCVLAVLCLIGQRLWATRPLVSGRVKVRGAHADVELLRDEGGVPHIFAQSEPDAYFGLGFVHAQDRVFQIELQQRMASGRLAELLGEQALASDKLFRTLGLVEHARESWTALDDATRAAANAYAAGYNAALDAGANAPELIGLQSAPTRMQALDCLVNFKLVAWQLSGNMLRELENHLLARKFTFEEIARLSPVAPGVEARAWPSPAYAGAANATTWLDDVARKMLQVAPAAKSGTGSNAWVVTGAHSQTGKPLLANDPHLGLSAPAVWYLAHLHAPGLNVIGASLPGTPGIWLGRNDHVAWGITNTGSDTQDLYMERLDGADPRRVVTPEGPRAMTERREQIRVRGGRTIEHVARATRHGPVVSEAEGYVLALAWTGLFGVDRSLQFAIKAAHARDAAQLLTAAADVRSPQQNLLYADDAGAVGLHAIGALPRRAAENAVLGRLPIPGWDATYDWQGELAFDDLPEQKPGEQGRVQNANDRITTSEYPHWVTSEWELPFRADRIAELLDEQPQHNLDDFARMQLDVIDPLAKELLPELLAQLGDAAAEHPELFALLRGWDCSMSADRPEALLFQAWVSALAERLYPRAFFELRPSADPRVLLAMLRGDSELVRYCGPELQRACARHVAESFRETVASLRTRYGTELADWRWGAHNRAWFGHALLSGVPGIERLVDLKLEREGSAETINLSVSSYDADSGEYITSIGPSLRALYDLAEPERSRFLVTPGQSGNPLSSRYRDLASRWSRGEYVPMITDRSVLRQKSHDTLILSP